MGRIGEDRSRPGARAFDVCFKAHHGAVLAYALRRVEDRASAEDVVAETFAVAWRRRDALPDNPLPWLYGIAARVLANQRRGSRRRLRLGGRLASQPQSSGRDPAELVGERDAVLVAFAGLSEAQREILRLVAWEGLGPREAATVLGCSSAAFRVRLHRARRALAKQLSEAGHVKGSNPAPRGAVEETT